MVFAADAALPLAAVFAEVLTEIGMGGEEQDQAMCQQIWARAADYFATVEGAEDLAGFYQNKNKQ